MRNRPRGFWGVVALFLAMLGLIVMVMWDDLLLFWIFDISRGAGVATALRVTVALVLMALNLGLAALAWQALRQTPQTGAEGMRGQRGVVTRVEAATIWVMVHGERWRAQSAQPVRPGDEIRVVGMHGLNLTVEKLEAGAVG